MTAKMEKVKNSGLMVPIIKVVIAWEKRKVKVTSSGRLEDKDILAVFRTISFKDLESTYGKTDEDMKVNSLKIRCTEKVNTYGLMEGNISVSTSMTRSMAMVSTQMKMGVSIEENG